MHVTNEGPKNDIMPSENRFFKLAFLNWKSHDEVKNKYVSKSGISKRIN